MILQVDLCPHMHTQKHIYRHTHTHPSVHIHMKSFGTLGKQGEKKKTTSVFAAHDANNTSPVWFISGSAHQRASLGQRSALQEPFLRRGVWKSESRSRGNPETTKSPLQGLRVASKKVQTTETCRWNGTAGVRKTWGQLLRWESGQGAFDSPPGWQEASALLLSVISWRCESEA